MTNLEQLIKDNLAELRNYGDDEVAALLSARIHDNFQVFDKNGQTFDNLPVAIEIKVGRRGYAVSVGGADLKQEE